MGITGMREGKELEMMEEEEDGVMGTDDDKAMEFIGAITRAVGRTTRSLCSEKFEGKKKSSSC
jgi:hypothetical protein